MPSALHLATFQDPNVGDRGEKGYPKPHFGVRGEVVVVGLKADSNLDGCRQ